MNVVDSSGWLEYFADGLNAEFFAVPIEETSHLIVPSIEKLDSLADQAIADFKAGKCKEI